MSKDETKTDPFEIVPCKEIDKLDEIPEPDGDEGDPHYLSFEEKLGIISVGISRPFEVSDATESVTTVLVQAPSSDDIKVTKGVVYPLLERCIVGWTKTDIKKFLKVAHGRDSLRLQRLMRHFLK